MDEHEKSKPFEAELSGLGQAASTPPATMASSQAQAEQVECPFCAELISARAKKCRYCSETLDVALRRAEEAMRASERTAPVYMNAGGGGGASASAGNGGTMLRPFNHGLHIFLSVITLGWWLPVYLILYLLRNKNYYY